MDEFYNNSRARFPEFRASILGFSRRFPLLREEGNTVLRRNAMKICMVGQGAFAKKHLEDSSASETQKSSVFSAGPLKQRKQPLKNTASRIGRRILMKHLRAPAWRP